MYKSGTVAQVEDPGAHPRRIKRSSRELFYERSRLMVTGIGILIALVVVAVMAWMMRGSSGPPDEEREEREERYCLKCGKVTWWHPDKGCEHCAWCERQW
jgi:hypothetical protein